MRKGWRLVSFLLLTFGGAALLARGPASGNAQSPTADKYIGTWAGTWDGSGSGEFELTLDKNRDQGKAAPLVGKVAVTTDGGNYNADLNSLSFEGPKMTAKYDFPLDPSAEVVVAATFEDRAAKGTWSLRPKGQETEIAGGSWTVTRK